MNHETPNERRTRLIERYVERNAHLGTSETWLDIETAIKLATELADAVIAATPQGPQQDDTTQAIINRLNGLCELAKDVFIRQKKNKSTEFDQVVINRWIENYTELEQQMHSEGL